MQEPLHEISKAELKQAQDRINYMLNQTEEERYKIYDTGFFNGVTRAYMKGAMLSAGVPSELIDKAIEELYTLHDTISAKDVIKEYS